MTPAIAKAGRSSRRCCATARSGVFQGKILVKPARRRPMATRSASRCCSTMTASSSPSRSWRSMPTTCMQPRLHHRRDRRGGAVLPALARGAGGAGDRPADAGLPGRGDRGDRGRRPADDILTRLQGWLARILRGERHVAVTRDPAKLPPPARRDAPPARRRRGGEARARHRLPDGGPASIIFISQLAASGRRASLNPRCGAADALLGGAPDSRWVFTLAAWLYGLAAILCHGLSRLGGGRLAEMAGTMRAWRCSGRCWRSRRCSCCGAWPGFSQGSELVMIVGGRDRADPFLDLAGRPVGGRAPRGPKAPSRHCP